MQRYRNYAIELSITAQLYINLGGFGLAAIGSIPSSVSGQEYLL